MWQNKMFDGIKAGQSRMEIAEAIGIPVRAVSLAALQMQSSPDYREAGITDKQFAEWFEKSLIGLKTEDGELVIERTEPLQKNVDSVLANIKKFESQELPVIKPVQPIPVDCINCSRNGFFTRCPKHAYADNKAIGCKYFNAR